MGSNESDQTAVAPDRSALPVVSLEQVEKAFDDHVVLDRLSLDVPHGQRLVVMGPSGSGKTTLLRVLMTLERPDAGVVRIEGVPLYHEERDGELVPARRAHTRRVRSNVSMVFQHFNLFPHKTALDNITLGPIRALGVPKAEARGRALALLERVGLAEKADSHPSELSGGQKQRVAIARALAMQPKVMLFDEVTSALDPELVGEVQRVLLDIAAEGETTMILVTHEVGFARDIADRVLMFDRGRIVEEAPPAQFFSDPANDRTREFLRAVLEGEA